MKVAISVHGRFHAFQLARELARRDALARLITSYPKFDAVRHGVPRELVSSVLTNELMRRAWGKLPTPVKGGHDPRLFLHEHFARAAAARLPIGADVHVGWCGAALAPLRRARELGMLTVVERGSSHVEHQHEILREEHARFGLPGPDAHPGVIQRELAEYEEADLIAIPSLFVERTFRARGFPAAKLLRVPYGVSLEGFAPPAQRPTTFRVMYCGAVTLQKGCHYLLQAFSELALPDAELWLVGRVADAMQTFRERFASSRIVFHGTKPEAELAAYYGQASVFCLASIQDGFGMVVPQAMACGLPVVASANTGAADLVREGVDGFVVPIRDVAALKERLLYLYEHADERAAMGAAARARVSAGFSWADYGAGVVAGYERALRERAVGPGRARAGGDR